MCTVRPYYSNCGPGTGITWEVLEMQSLRLCRRTAEPEPAFCQDLRQFLCAFKSEEPCQKALGNADVISRCGHRVSWGRNLEERKDFDDGASD